MKGCGKATHGKPYCLKHATIALRRVVPDAARANMRSGCCDAKCVSGVAHDDGEQYCTKCKQPCHWKMVKPEA